MSAIQAIETEGTFADIMIVIYWHKQASTVNTGPWSLEVVEERIT